MLPDRVSNPGPLTYESGVLPIALRGPAERFCDFLFPSLHKELHQNIDNDNYDNNNLKVLCSYDHFCRILLSL